MIGTLLVCETCGFDECEPDATRKGELFARELEQKLAEQTDFVGEFPQLRRYRCLMSCKRHCVVQLRAPGKLGYVIGDFVPNAAAADTLLEYSRKYLRSETGQVAYKEWPDGIKGKFIARIPVLDE